VDQDQTNVKRIALLTSGGDAPGMNAAVRSVVRTALEKDLEIYAVYEGYQGLVDGGDRIRPLGWNDVGGILHRGGTAIGSARCARFREREGRLDAALNLSSHGIEGLIVIGGDGTLTGAHILRTEWPDLLAELVESGRITAEQADVCRDLAVVGIVGSIDNDFYGTDMTIGADSALHRITEAVDAISSTASSHQRCFVVEVMGRHCGYLALMGALATGADWVLIPEYPPEMEDWESKMCEVLRLGREYGRRHSIVIVAEGAQDRSGVPIESSYVKKVLQDQLGEDTRVTILGHVQRGGSPSAFDRNLSTVLGAAAVEAILVKRTSAEIPVIGVRGNKISHTYLSECLSRTTEVSRYIANRDYDMALKGRGGSFASVFDIFRTLQRAYPHEPVPGQRRLRIALMNAGAPSPGMNNAARAAVRLALDKGHTVIGVSNGFRGLKSGEFRELQWMDVNGWAHRGGAELGTNRFVPEEGDLYAIARNLEEWNIEALLVIGGGSGYQAALNLYEQRSVFPAFNIPIICIPATIDNNLPGSELSVGADTALNNIITAVDKIKQSAVASRRVFVVEVMGRYCGYLALMSALATGAERVYLPEEGVTLADMVDDVGQLVTGFNQGKRLGVIIRNEMANETYTTGFMCALFEEEGGDLFDVRQAILGHIQQGGNPSPFDRIMATRLATACINQLELQVASSEPESSCIGLQHGKIVFTSFDLFNRLMDWDHRRPREQWWLGLRPIARVLAQPAPKGGQE
jgi:6-phosphofructokinase 1